MMTTTTRRLRRGVAGPATGSAASSGGDSWLSAGRNESADCSARSAMLPPSPVRTTATTTGAKTVRDGDMPALRVWSALQPGAPATSLPELEVTHDREGDRGHARRRGDREDPGPH